MQHRSLLVLLVAFAAGSLACSCLPRTFLEHFSSADNVVRVDVLFGPINFGAHAHYIVRVRNIFKKHADSELDCGEVFNTHTQPKKDQTR